MIQNLKIYHENCKKEVVDILNTYKTYIYHVRDKKGMIIGTLFASKEHDQIYVGWSKCNPVDKFNRSVAILKAHQKATHIGEWMRNKEDNLVWIDGTIVPKEIRKNLPEFVERVSRRFTKTVTN